jgi:hypothetical protein
MNSDIRQVNYVPRNRRGRRKKISFEVEQELITWATSNNDNALPVTGKSLNLLFLIFVTCYYTGEGLIAHAFEVHRISLSRSYVSRLMKRNGFASRRTLVSI